MFWPTFTSFGRRYSKSRSAPASLGLALGHLDFEKHVRKCFQPPLPTGRHPCFYVLTPIVKINTCRDSSFCHLNGSIENSGHSVAKRRAAPGQTSKQDKKEEGMPALPPSETFRKTSTTQVIRFAICNIQYKLQNMFSHSNDSYFGQQHHTTAQANDRPVDLSDVRLSPKPQAINLQPHLILISGV